MNKAGRKKPKPEGWREVKLGEIAEISKANWKVGDKPFPYIGLEHIEENTLRLNSIGDSSSLESNKYRFKSGDVLFGKLRPYFRKVVKPNFNGICSTDIWVIRAKENMDDRFMFYFFANRKLVDIAYSSCGGTRMPRADWSFLSQTAWNIPPLAEQKAIAGVLSSLDEKIDLLHRQNKTLEDMAQTLFHQWFIKQADKRWKKKHLGETVDIAIGRTPPRKEFEWFSKESGDWKWISIKDMAENGIYLFDTSEYLTQQAVDRFAIRIIPANTVILSFKMTVGRVRITAEDMLSNEAIAHFAFNHETPYSREYLYFYLKIFRFASLGSTSSIVTSINTAMIKSMMIAIPGMTLMKRFESAVKPLFNKIKYNQHSIYSLMNLRDALLPKLVGGKVSLRP